MIRKSYKTGDFYIQWESKIVFRSMWTIGSVEIDTISFFLKQHLK
jgi:hypothetical protein